MTKTLRASPAAEKAANSLLSLQKPQTIPKIVSASDAIMALLFHRRFNLNDDDDGRDYQVQVLCSFNIGKKRVALVHFVGYSTDYDRIIPMSRLRNFRG
jgi:hypothetical protein